MQDFSYCKAGIIENHKTMCNCHKMNVYDEYTPNWKCRTARRVAVRLDAQLSTDLSFRLLYENKLTNNEFIVCSCYLIRNAIFELNLRYYAIANCGIRLWLIIWSNFTAYQKSQLDYQNWNYQETQFDKLEHIMLGIKLGF